MAAGQENKGYETKMVLIGPATGGRPQAPGKTHLYMAARPLPAGTLGELESRRPELDLKRYDLKQPDFEGIWLPIEG